MDEEIRIVDRSAIIALERLSAEAPSALTRGLKKVGLLLGRAVASKAPKKSRRLARSFLQVRPAGNSIIVGDAVPIYGAIQNYGGTIVPKNGPFLIFPIDGKFVRARSVTIPGKHFAESGIEFVKPRAPMIIGKEISSSFHA